MLSLVEVDIVFIVKLRHETELKVLLPSSQVFVIFSS